MWKLKKGQAMKQTKEKKMDVGRSHDAAYLSAEKVGELLTSESCVELDVPDEKLRSIVAAGIAEDEKKLQEQSK